MTYLYVSTIFYENQGVAFVMAFDDLAGSFASVKLPPASKKAARPYQPAKILMMLHREQSTPARVGRFLRMRGYILDQRRIACGDEFPQNLADYKGIVVFGGPMSCNDPDPWIAREIAFLEKALALELPLLGICLGAQMLARQLGAKVSCHPLGHAEIGYYPIEPTPAGDKLCSTPMPRMVYHWHRDGFELPKDALLLAHGRGDFPVQAFCYGRAAVGLQFHPEVTYAMMCRWTVTGHERLALPGAQSRERHLSGWFAHDPAVARWLSSFLDAWLAKKLTLPADYNLGAQASQALPVL